MNRRLLVVLLSCLLILPAHAQGSFLNHLHSELAPLDRLEKLFVIKLAENKITEQMRDIATDAKSRKDGTVWGMKVASFCYGTLTLLLESHFPAVAEVYRARTELYSDVVRGTRTLSDVEPLERENETQKTTLLDREFKSLQASHPKPSLARTKYLKELGPQLGQTISYYAIRAW
jgi:hypothetical protein